MEFLFENPFLAIILIAVILSFFKKKRTNPEMKKKAQHAEQHRQPRYERPIEEVRDLLKEITRTFAEETKPRSRKMSKGTDIKNRIEKQIQQAPPETVVQNAGENQPLPESSFPMLQEKKSEQELEVNAGQLVDAIIWSEILGPPRAKNPYMKGKGNH